MRVTTTTCGLRIVAALVAMMSAAYADVEVGGHAGATATNTRTTYDCPDNLPPNEICITSESPGHGLWGAALGAYVRQAISPHIRLEGELLYSTKGYDSGSKVRFHYIEVPLLARLSNLEDASHMRAFVHAGLAPALLVHCHNWGEAFDNDKREIYSYSSSCADGPVIDRTPWRFDLGVVFGAGFEWNLDIGLIDFEVRVARSVLDIERDEGGKTINHGVYFLLGFGRVIGPP